MLPYTPVKKPKRKRKLRRFIVTLDGVPCARRKDPRIGTDRKLTQLRGTLRKCHDSPEEFKGEKSANRAIGFAIRTRKRLEGAICDLSPIVSDYAGEFKVHPVEAVDLKL